MEYLEIRYEDIISLKCTVDECNVLYYEIEYFDKTTNLHETHWVTKVQFLNILNEYITMKELSCKKFEI